MEGARGCPRALFLSYLPSIGGRCRLQGKVFFMEGWGEVMRFVFWSVSFFFLFLCALKWLSLESEACSPSQLMAIS